MFFKNQKIQKVITTLVLIAIIASPLFIAPKKAHAFLGFGDIVVDIITGIKTAISAAVDLYEKKITVKNELRFVLNQIAKSVARKALTELTKGTVNWINSGFHGKPLFLENPDSFFRDITKFEIRNLVDIFGRDPLRFPYGRQVSLNFIDAYKRQLDVNAAYSLSNVIRDEAYLSNYRNNFNIGGWNGLFLHTQYPQNNAIGFQMLANEELARRIDAGPTPNNEIGKVQDLLQQGQGFLSPQVCRSNPSLVQNPYNPPTFEFDEDPPIADNYKTTVSRKDPASGLYVQETTVDPKYFLDQSAYNSRKGIAQVAWTNQNTCTGGWANTTPGYVAASQVTRALGSNFSQTELGAALGGSLSAIFDALLNKLVNPGGGLNALASKRNALPENEDNWDYLGNTLGSPDDNPNRDIFSGPDQEIILQEFKDDVQRGITDTKAELALLDNPNSTNYGAIQMLSAIWPRVRQLDLCLPGPNYGWEGRLNDEMSRASVKIQEKVGDENSKKSAAATLILKELQFAASFFKDWVRTKIMQTLPSSILFLDAIDETEMFDQQIIEITDSKRFKAQALARLEAIAGALSAFTTQPTSDTPAEKDLIKIKKQYNLILYQISNPDTLEESKAQLDALKDKLASLNKMVNRCATERVSNGWNIPAGEWSDPDGRASFRIGTTGSEAEQFCILPIAGGYTHEMFINKSPTYPEIPLLNTKVKVRLSGTRDLNFDIKLSCNTIFRSYTIDYKGNIPGEIKIIEPPPPPNDTGDDLTGEEPPPGDGCGAGACL